MDLTHLEKYKQKGCFLFRPTDRLSSVCNAPSNCSGIYLIYAKAGTSNSELLIYIGISGREGKSGGIIHRKNGLRGRFLTGKQFGDLRHRSWPKQMQFDNITCLRIEWYVTYGELDRDIPRHIEKQILEDYDPIDQTLPLWNKVY